MAHIFVSYVMENARLAEWVVKQLRANGLDPWFSKEPGRIGVGDDWRRSLHTAIQGGGYYLPIFTREWAQRQRSVANQELMIAAEEARMRPPGRAWFLPLKVDDQPLPEVDLGGGRRLSDIQYVDVPQLGWRRGLQSLLRALGVDEPIIDRGEPIAPGFGDAARIAGGFVTYRNLSVPIPELEGTSFTVTGGQIIRTDTGELGARFTLRAPFEQLQEINAQLGLDCIDVQSPDPTISTDPQRPSRFSYIDEKDHRSPGSPVWMMGEPAPLQTEIAIDQVTGYEAIGHLNSDDQIVGVFRGFVETASAIGSVRVTFDGEFTLQIADAVIPPAN